LHALVLEILPFLILNADLRVDDVMRGHGLMCALQSFSLIFLPPFFLVDAITILVLVDMGHWKFQTLSS
jgi:hypothetical protein